MEHGASRLQEPSDGSRVSGSQQERGDMREGETRKILVDATELSGNLIDSEIQTNSVRSLGEAASYYGRTNGATAARIGMSERSRSDLVKRAREHIAELRSEIGISDTRGYPNAGPGNSTKDSGEAV